MKKTSLTLTQKIAWVYAIGFYIITALGYISTFNDGKGLLFGLFNLGLQDNLLHLFSALWATFAALRSHHAAKFYLRWFGLYYTADAFTGMLTGYTIIDILIGNWSANEGFSHSHFSYNVSVNLPHFIIGPVAVLSGYLLDRKIKIKK